MRLAAEFWFTHVEIKKENLTRRTVISAVERLDRDLERADARCPGRLIIRAKDTYTVFRMEER